MVDCDGPPVTEVPTDDNPATDAVENVPGATSLSVGARHACAVVDGDVVCWGSNETGQTGPDGSGNALPKPVTVAPRVHATGPADLASPIEVVFDDVVDGVSPGDLVVRDVGAAVVDARLTCLDVAGALTPCDGPVGTAQLWPRPDVVAGETWFVQVGGLTSGGLAVPATTLTVAGPDEFGEDGLGGAAYSWDKVRDDRALGGELVRERTAGASASYDFSGARITWYTVKGRSQGLASVAVDGKKVATVDNSAAKTSYRVARTFRGLGAGDHTLTVTALGSRGSKGDGAVVSVDGFESKAGRDKNPTLETRWGAGALAPSAPGVRRRRTGRAR